MDSINETFAKSRFASQLQSVSKVQFSDKEKLPKPSENVIILQHTTVKYFWMIRILSKPHNAVGRI